MCSPGEWGRYQHFKANIPFKANKRIILLAMFVAIISKSESSCHVSLLHTRWSHTYSNENTCMILSWLNELYELFIFHIICQAIIFSSSDKFVFAQSGDQPSHPYQWLFISPFGALARLIAFRWLVLWEIGFSHSRAYHAPEDALEFPSECHVEEKIHC